MMVTTVKVHSCKKPTYWYSTEIGQEFKVVSKVVPIETLDYPVTLFEVIDDGLEGNYILPGDCQIMKIEKHQTH